MNGEEEQEGVPEFVSQALRGPKQGAFENLLAQYCSLAVASNSLKKINLICNAAMVISDEQREQIKVDLEEVKALYNVCIGFQSALIYEQLDLVRIPWHFHIKAKFEKWIDPWYNGGIWFQRYKWEELKYPDRIKTDMPNWMYKLQLKKNKGEISEEEANKKYRSDYFYTITRTRLTLHGYKDLRNQFLKYAMPKVSMLQGKIARLITPALYNEILKLYTTKKEE